MPSVNLNVQSRGNAGGTILSDLTADVFDGVTAGTLVPDEVLDFARSVDIVVLEGRTNFVVSTTAIVSGFPVFVDGRYIGDSATLNNDKIFKTLKFYGNDSTVLYGADLLTVVTQNITTAASATVSPTRIDIFEFDNRRINMNIEVSQDAFAKLYPTNYTADTVSILDETVVNTSGEVYQVEVPNLGNLNPIYRTITFTDGTEINAKIIPSTRKGHL